ncbi:MAG: glycosyltransferase [Actinomycetota bacterium]
MRIGSAVLHYRFWPGIRATLEALVSQTRAPDLIVVVDNDSRDGSVSELGRAFPGVEVLEAGENRGYGAGMNIGIARLLAQGADAVLLLTHECLLDPEAVEALVGRLEEDPAVGVVGPLLGDLNRPDAVYSAGGQIDQRTWKTAHLRVPELMDDWREASPRRVEWLDGAALLIRADALRAGAKIDEEYFMYFEETEYQLKLRELGWPIECVPAARAWQRSSGKPPYLWTRNRLRFVSRTAPNRLLAREIVRLTRSLVRDGLHGGSGAERAVRRARRRGLVDFLFRRWGPDPSALEQPRSFRARDEARPA